jgi:glyoxalase family protein
MTFFPWASVPPLAHAGGRPGAGQVVTTSFAIPSSSFDFWVDRLAGTAIDFEVPEDRFGERRLALRDPDGIALELVATERLPASTWWSESPVPAEHAIASIHGVAILVQDAAETAERVTRTLGFTADGADGTRQRFRVGDGGSVLEVVEDPAAPDGRMGIGTVHHVAWRVPSREAEERFRQIVAATGTRVTDVLDRQYFESIYFREPGGVLFELATDPPGFMRDEPADSLGSALKLPPWLEERRPAIEAKLPRIGPPRAWRL